MTDGFPYADLVVLALVAGLVLLRLRAVLGEKMGHEAPPAAPKAVSAPVVQMSEKAKQALLSGQNPDEKLLAEIANPEARHALEAMQALDKDFSLSQFLEGAKGAFEMVFDAFVKDDRDTLKMLLSDELFTTFSAELDKRKGMETHPETTLLALVSQGITAAGLQKSIARITIRHVSEQVSIVRDKTGKIIEGDPSASQHVEDHWVFERDMNSRNPNWKIIET